FPKLDAGKHPLRDTNHLPGKVDADRNRAALGCGRGNIAGAATNIEQRHSDANFRLVEQWPDELAGRAGPDGIVLISDPFPAFMLELSERVHPLPFQRPNPAPSLTTIMFKRILPVLLVSGSLVLAADNSSPTSPGPAKPPSEDSIKQLLEVAQAHKLVDAVMRQMDNLMQQTIAQASQGQKIPPAVEKD